MKKILVILVFAVLLSSCDEGGGGAFIDIPTVIDQADTDEKMGCLIEVAQIMGTENEAALAINADIMELSQIMQDTYMDDEFMWCEMTAWPTETEQYINLTVMLNELPSYGTSGQLMSWVYDKEAGRQVELDEALLMAETDMESIAADIGEWCVQNDYECYSDLLDFLAFRMTESGEPQFMTSKAITPAGLIGEIDPWSCFFTWTDGKVEWTAYVPFDPAEVNGSFSNGLLCQTYEDMGQYEGDAAIISEYEAAELFEEIYDINKYLEAGMTIRFDGSTEEIGGETCIRAVLGTEENGEFIVQGHYAATWGNVYYLDPSTGDWTPVGFG